MSILNAISVNARSMRWFCLPVLLLASCQNQEPRSISNVGNNYLLIDSTMHAADIIEKAANIAPSPRQLKWQQKELVAFIHFGINTFTNREWGTGQEDPALFNPTALDAEQWVRSLKDAGFKEVILTAKHHDGFCLWPSAYTTHSVKNSPWKGGKGDVVRELADACHKYGVDLGIYLSPWDRNYPFYGNTEKYNAYFEHQLTELLTNYGKVTEVWFDGANGEGPNGKVPEYHFQSWYQLIRRLQPEAVISVMGPDVRWVGTESGYGRDTEWSVVSLSEQDPEQIAANSQQQVLPKDSLFKPRRGMSQQKDLGSREKILHSKALAWYPAETNTSIRPGWFYHADQDAKVKSPEKLYDTYFNSVGKNGVFLLNFPPDTRGLIHEQDLENIKAWRVLLDSTFRVNLAAGAAVESTDGIGSEAILDGVDTTYWTTNGADTTGVLELTLNAPRTFDVLALQENIHIGQRIEAFRLDVWADGAWKEVTSGTTVGYKRLLRFDAVTTDKVRLSILASRSNPTLAEFGLYKRPAAVE